MSSIVSPGKAFVSIQRLTEIMEFPANDIHSEVVELYLVCNGGITIRKKGVWVSLEANTLFWTCFSADRLLTISAGTEGYVIRFSKGWLQHRDWDLCSSVIETFYPLPRKGEIIRLDESFLGEGVGLCELMQKENQQPGDKKRLVLAELLGVFLLQMIRRSNAIMYI